MLFFIGIVEMFIVTSWTKVVADSRVIASGTITFINILIWFYHFYNRRNYDFIKMLLRDEENLAKQIFRNHILFFNPDIYYKLMMEAHKNGFRT